MNLINLFTKKTRQLGANWKVRGLLSANDKIYSLTSDTKVLSTVFELLVGPILHAIADEQGLILKVADSQTLYPDFTIMHSENDQNKIAVDVKTTYRRGVYKKGPRNSSGKIGDLRPFGFTLGSYASYLRNNTKNIQYPYDTYSKHYIIGFVYSRNTLSTEGEITALKDRKRVKPPYLNVEYFIQEKYKISGDKPGSGNTENIGSFSTNRISDFKKGRGPFTKLGEKVFEDYWKNYGGYRNSRAYTSLEGYLKWKNGKK